MKSKKHILLAALLAVFASCGKENPIPVPDTDPTPTPVDTISKPIDPEPEPEPEPEPQLVKGTDISWCTAMEDAGKKFYGFASRDAKECTAVMKELGANAIRLRVLVNPSDGYCSMDDVLNKARRAADLGMDLMVDFHYSDQQATAESQSIPAAWQGHDYNQLLQDVKDHTREVLSVLKSAEIAVRWVQIGNETSNGLLWPVGQADDTSNPAQYRGLIEAGAAAARAVYPDAKIVVHLPYGYDQNLFRNNLNLLNKSSYDIVGMSLFPSRYIGREYYTSSGARKTIANKEQAIQATFENMQYITNYTGKDCMVVECGLPVQTEVESTNLMNDIMDRARKSPYCLGVFYWEPEAYQGWQGYECGAFLQNGRPTQILNSFEI